mgnify:CR=1 FL=1
MERVLRPIFAAGPVIQAAIHNCEDMFLAPGKRPQFRPSLSWQAGPIGPEDYQAIMPPKYTLIFFNPPTPNGCLCTWVLVGPASS